MSQQNNVMHSYVIGQGEYIEHFQRTQLHITMVKITDITFYKLHGKKNTT